MFTNAATGKIKLITLTDATAVASGGGASGKFLSPPEGKIYRIIGLYWNIPAIGGAAGNHQIEIITGENVFNVASIIGAGNASININNSTFTGTTLAPNDAAAQEQICNSSLMVSSDYRINFKYTNNSDTNQTGSRTLVIMVYEFQECV